MESTVLSEAIDAKLQARKVYDAVYDVLDTMKILEDLIVPAAMGSTPQAVLEGIKIARARAQVAFDAASEADLGAYNRLPSAKAKSSEAAIQEFHGQYRVRELRAGL